MNKAFCVWLTGLSASGKSTQARLLKEALEERGYQVEVLDGDVIRRTLSQGLGFSREDRETNLRRIAFVANLLVKNGVVAIVAAISPYEQVRQVMRSEISNYVEVFLNCPVEICMRRDPKGLYRKAMAGEIQHFTGIDDPFEIPCQADIEIRPHEEAPEKSLNRILQSLGKLQGIPLRPLEEKRHSRPVVLTFVNPARA